MSAVNPRHEGFDEPHAGGRIGRYRLLGLLATGGMAQVYLALSGELSGFRTLVVVKRILPHLSSNRQFIDMFFDEARIAARLEHPNIVRIIEVGQDRDEYFLAMEVVQGKPLSALLRRAIKHRTPLSHAQSAFLVAQAANGLAYAHNLSDAEGRPLNVVHRDVSPQNILVSFDGAVKVIDFGVARALGRVAETVPGGLKGKIQYMAPEQVSGDEVDRRSDVFALGIVLWEALCGRRLYRRESEFETLRAIVHDEPPRPSTMVQISSRLERIVMRALARNPAERFQSASEMALALERHAFANEDFNPAQLATCMKALFPSDQARWRATVATTTHLEGEPDEWKNTSGTFVRPEGVESPTRDRTVWLRRGLPPGAPSNGRPQHEALSDGEGVLSTSVSLPLMPLPPPRMKRRIHFNQAIAVGAGMILAVLVAGSWSAISRRHGLTAVTAASATTGPRARGATTPVITPLLPSVPGGAKTAGDPPAPAAGPAVAASDGPETSASPPRSKEAGNHPGAHRRGGSKRRSHGSAVDGDDARDEAPAVAATGDCSVVLGSQPWSEIWIDGKSTKKHTPYSEPIGCGAHEVAFVRSDLDLDRAISIKVRPGKPFKKIFRFPRD